AAAAAPSARPSANKGRSYPVSSQSLEQIERITSMGPEPSLSGMISFIYDVEPSFYETLIRKYGRGTISSIQNGIRVSLK
ncbi:MAG: hypothetical protein KJ824_03950, partial [Alphaproteobacteria bacterium]|nr:hypothetical protein [Alphaproteobacteria bacterium]